MRTCRALLDAAEGKSLPLVQPAPFNKRPIGSMKCLAAVLPKQEDFEAQARSALVTVQDMMKSEQRDSNLLGMENLCCLTDPLKTNATVSLYVSKALVLGSDKMEMREELRLLMERDSFTQDSEAVGPSNHGEHMRLLALCVMANALNMCAQDGSLSRAVQEQRWFADHLFPSLMEELEKASISMNSACKAASCLQSLLSCSPAMRQEGGFRSVLESAHAVGKARHELLANETRRCLEALGL